MENQTSFRIGETFGRKARFWINKEGEKILQFTDWEARRGGTMFCSTIEQAKYIAEQFINGHEYRWDEQEGIKL